jgi:hypothetical protein
MERHKPGRVKEHRELTRMRRFSRRMWVAGGLVWATAAGAWVVAGASYQWRRVKHPTASDLADIVSHRLAHLPLEASGVEAFAEEYVHRFGTAPMVVHQERTLGGMLCFDSVLWRLPLEQRQPIVDFERGLIARYLLSTTYFHEPAGAPVRYVAFADPYEVGCANPLARLGE